MIDSSVVWCGLSAIFFFTLLTVVYCFKFIIVPRTEIPKSCFARAASSSLGPFDHARAADDENVCQRDARYIVRIS